MRHGNCLTSAGSSDKSAHIPSVEKEKVLGSDAGGDRKGLVGTAASGSQEASSGADGGRRRARGAPATPRPRSFAFPAARARRGSRSPGAVAGRGVQGALWPSGAGGWSGGRDAGGFVENHRLQHLGRPTAVCAPPPGSPVLPGTRVAAAAREPMRLGWHWASEAPAAAAATTSPSGVRGFAAAPVAAPVPSWGGDFRLGDDSPRPW